MTMHDQLPETAARFDVGQQRTPPTVGESDPPDQRADVGHPLTTLPESDADSTQAEAEVARLEALLFTQTKLRREQAQELVRRSSLLRDACARLAEFAPTTELNALRAERDAAVSRAIDAEVARAEATFKLDEALGHLHVRTAPAELPAGLLRPASEHSETVRALKGRVAALEEQLETADARRQLAEHELEHAERRVAEATRERVEDAERLELELAQSQTRAEAILRRIHEAERNRDIERARLEDEIAQAHRSGEAALAAAQEAALAARERDEAAREVERGNQTAQVGVAGELLGLRHRMQESERALAATQDRQARSQRSAAELQHKLDSARAEQAAHAARADANAARVVELQSDRASDQDSVRQLRDELARAQAARDRLAALESDAPGDEDTTPGQGGTPPRERVRALYRELRVPLVTFEAELDVIARGDERSAMGLPVAEAPVDPAILELEEKMRGRDARIAELEAGLSKAREAVREANLTSLKGELIDVRANAARLSDDLAKERARRRKMGVTVRALQAAAESGEALGPWVDELVAAINEGASLPPKA